VLAWLSAWSEVQTCTWAQLMPLPLTVSCFSKIQIDLFFLVPAHLGSPGKRAVKRMCVCVCVLMDVTDSKTIDRGRYVAAKTKRASLQGNAEIAGLDNDGRMCRQLTELSSPSMSSPAISASTPLQQLSDHRHRVLNLGVS